MISIRIYKDIPQGKLVVNFETSPRVVHKRNSSQNMPIWEHKRSSSIILCEIAPLLILG